MEMTALPVTMAIMRFHVNDHKGAPFVSCVSLYHEKAVPPGADVKVV